MTDEKTPVSSQDDEKATAKAGQADETTAKKKPAKGKREYNAGMVVKVHERIKETNAKGEEKERIQIFEGMIIAAKHGTEPGATITVRKESKGYGVEKIFPINSPVVPKIEILKEMKVKRAKLHYLRDPKHKRKLRVKK